MVDEEKTYTSPTPTASLKASKSLSLISSFNTFITNINRGGLEDVNEKIHIKAFKMLIGIQRAPIKKSPNSPPTPSTKPSSDVFLELIQQLKTKVFYMDLFQAIKENHAALYGIKGLLEQLNKPGAPESISSFILDFKLFLE